MTAPQTTTEDHVRILYSAITDRRPVRLTYTALDGEQTVRTIEPYAIDQTLMGYLIVRAMDRRSGDYRSFRAERIETVTFAPGGFLLPNPLATDRTLMPTILIRYIGSSGTYHGDIMRLLGVCGCHRCCTWGVRYRLAEVGDYVAVARCVRAESIADVDEEEIAAFHAQREAALLAALAEEPTPSDTRLDDALARIRAEIAEVPIFDHCGDAARWSPN